MDRRGILDPGHLGDGVDCREHGTASLCPARMDICSRVFPGIFGPPVGGGGKSEILRCTRADSLRAHPRSNRRFDRVLAVPPFAAPPGHVQFYAVARLSSDKNPSPRQAR